MSGTDLLRDAFRKALDLQPTMTLMGWSTEASRSGILSPTWLWLRRSRTSFDVMIDTDEVIDMSSFAKAKEILRNHNADIND